MNVYDKILRIFEPKEAEMTGEWRKISNEKFKNFILTSNIWAGIAHLV
jgi:hypothetical protein